MYDSSPEVYYDADQSGSWNLSGQDLEPWEDRNCNGVADVALSDVEQILDSSVKSRWCESLLGTWDDSLLICFMDEGNGMWDDKILLFGVVVLKIYKFSIRHSKLIIATMIIRGSFVYILMMFLMIADLIICAMRRRV